MRKALVRATNSASALSQILQSWQLEARGQLLFCKTREEQQTSEQVLAGILLNYPLFFRSRNFLS